MGYREFDNFASAAMTSDNEILVADKFDHQIQMCPLKVYDSYETVCNIDVLSHHQVHPSGNVFIADTQQVLHTCSDVLMSCLVVEGRAPG